MGLARSPTQYKGVRAIAPPDLTIADRVPTASDTAYVKGTLWLYPAGLSSFQFSGVSWIELGTGVVGDIATLTGGTGGAIAPVGGNISLLGTANQITTTGTAGTLTWSLPAAITAPGSLTTTTTLAAGTALTAGTTITAGTGITSTTGNITSSAGNVVATTGSVTAGATVTSGTTMTAGTGLIVTTGGITVNGGDIINAHSDAGTDVTIEVTNSDNTNGASRAGVEIATGGSSSGDPYLRFEISGVGASTMTMGLDNSASDLFVISNSTAIGTSNALTLSQAGALTATTTVTATLGDITATNGNFVASTAGTGILLNSSQASGAAASPVVVNGRSGRATFTSVSIAAAADLTLTITNSAITAATTEVMLSMSGATTGSALSIKSKTASAGSLAIVVTNGTGATTTTADIEIDFLVLNA